jgi:hypothetical protein
MADNARHSARAAEARPAAFTDHGDHARPYFALIPRLRR